MTIRSLIKITCAILLAVTIFAMNKPGNSGKIQLKESAKHVVPFRLLSKGNKRFATGFYLKYNKKNYILTNRHVCDANKRVYGHDSIQFEDYVGKIIAIDVIHDLCLVTSNKKDGLELAEEDLKELDKVYLIGFPRGLGKTIREGRMVESLNIFAPWLDGQIVDTQMISTISYGGNSGSPVLNTKGKVAGVLFAGSRYIHTEGYIVPLTYVKLFLSIYAQ